MKRSLLISLATILIVVFSTVALQSQKAQRKVENKAFGVGERLQYEVRYGIVKAGTAVWEIPKIENIRNHSAYKIVFTVLSNPSFDWIFKVRDRYESYMDVAGIFPWRFEQHIKEGSFSRDYEVDFDHDNCLAYTQKAKYTVPQYVHDIVSAFFYVRTFDFSKMKKGQTIQLQNFFHDKTYPLEVLYLGKQQVEIGLGKFNCLVVQPVIKEGGLFKNTGNITIWLTDDQVKVPVKVKTKVVIGSIDADLIHYQGLQNKLNYAN